jgi:hypothetical protein
MGNGERVVLKSFSYPFLSYTFQEQIISHGNGHFGILNEGGKDH